MALFGPQARLERCLWWANLAGWPNGASEARTNNCYEKVFGRTSGISAGAVPKGAMGQVGSGSTQPIQPKNDLLTIAVGSSIEIDHANTVTPKGKAQVLDVVVNKDGSYLITNLKAPYENPDFAGKVRVV
jgi:hypothetical protein